MDYVCIGANGFAQMGDPLFGDKLNAERGIIMNLLIWGNPIPDEFSNIAMYYWKPFHHEFGTYREAVINFDDKQLSSFPEDYIERFWEFVNSIESIDLESEAITEKIKTAYLATLNVEGSEHLSIAV